MNSFWHGFEKAARDKVDRGQPDHESYFTEDELKKKRRNAALVMGGVGALGGLMAGSGKSAPARALAGAAVGGGATYAALRHWHKTDPYTWGNQREDDKEIAAARSGKYD